MSSMTPPSSGPESNRPSDAMPQNGAESVDAWGEAELEDESLLENEEATALIGSMLVHLIIILTLALVPLSAEVDDEAVVLVSPPEYEREKIETIEDITYSEVEQTEMGANSDAEMDMSEASAAVFSETAEIPNPVELDPVELGQIEVNNVFTEATAPLDKLEDLKGKVGQGTQGAKGAVDRLTFEILQSLEERPTLVVWLFDQSGSLHRQRQEIRDRFERIYTELGIAKDSDIEAFSKEKDDQPLLTSVIGFGSNVTLYTEEPTEDLEEIKSIVDNIQVDSTGEEKVFSAISSAADKYKGFRRMRAGREPQRNVLFVVVTDEKGDDGNMLEKSISSCRKLAIPVYVIGVPAPFGRAHSLVKYVDPDPKYDQSPQWAQVDQGPETFLPERVQVGFTANFEAEPVIDSGFGPYALTRLCYETGGIYFTVHPNRNVNRQVKRGEIDPYASDLKYFFDPVAMSRYRPDYLSQQDYVNMVKASPLRQALVSAAQMKPASGLARPKTRFVKMSDPQLVGDLTSAQQDAAKLEPTLVRMAQTLNPGMKVRDEEQSLRWKAGFDLAMGRVLAQKVRTETYNAMLAKAKRGMAFEDGKNNTWELEPSEEISVGSKWKNEAETATELLKAVANEHKGTPWALLAQQELSVPIGWKWEESFTDLAPPAARGAGNNNNNNVPRPAQDDKARMLKKVAKRPVPKL